MIEGVAENGVHEIYDFNGDITEGEYLFSTNSGELRYFYTAVISGIRPDEVKKVYKASTEGYVIDTGDGLRCGGTVLNAAEFPGGLGLFGTNSVIAVSENKIQTYKVNTNNRFSLTGTHYYSNIVLDYCGREGVVFHDGNGLYGYFNHEGKLMAGPKFYNVNLSDNFVFAVTASGGVRLYDRSGFSLSSSEFVDSPLTSPHGSYALMQGADGRCSLLSSNGTVISGNAEFIEIAESYVTGKDDYISSGELSSFQLRKINSDFSYELIAIDGAVQVLRIGRSL
jgi:hypothetical protein